MHAVSGDTASAEDFAARALRLSPFDPLSLLAFHAIGAVRLREGRFDEAAALYSKAVQTNPRFTVGYAFHTAAMAQAGRTEEAKVVAGRLLALDSSFTVRRFGGPLHPIFKNELIGVVEAGLRLAGVPE
jgi:tetratricopeptide (TPR) repeat protein